MQIGFVQNAKKLEPIILSQDKYLEAANYSIEKEKLSIVSSFYSFIIFILWVGFGLSFLDSITNFEATWLKAVFL
jgi:STE24 endopeptidase